MTEGGASKAPEPEIDSPVPEPRWPERPDGCPLTGASPIEGAFYRLAKPGDERAWFLPLARYPSRYERETDPANRCRMHAFSVFADKTDLVHFRAANRKFRKHRIVRVSVAKEMGVLLRVNPEGDTHTSWWPSEAFEPPPPTEDADQ